MKIDSFIPSLPPDGVERGAQSGTSKTAAANPGQTLRTGDQADLGTSSDRISTLASQALSAPEIRNQRVSTLAAAVATGHYQVDSQQIAGALYSQLRLRA